MAWWSREREGALEIARATVKTYTGDGAESTGWLAERGNPRRSALRRTRPKRKRTLSCEGKRRS